MLHAADRQTLATYVEDRISIEPNSGCWLWLLSDGSHGYPQGAASKITGEQVSLAHRLSYLAQHGEIPTGHDIDHLCRVKCCVNPNHLEAVTPHANRSRQFGIPAPADTSAATGCPKEGHGEYAIVAGRKVCRQCARERNRRYDEKRRAAT